MVIGRINDGEGMVEVLFSAHFSIFPVPYLYQEMLHIDFLALHFNHPRMFKHSPRSGTTGGFFLKTGRVRQQMSPVEVEHSNAEQQKGGYIPAFDKVLERSAPRDPVLRFIFQSRNWLPDNIGEKVNQPSFWLHFCAIGWKGEAMLSDFKKRDAQRPDIGCDGVGLARYPFRSHVIGCTNESIGIALGPELSADPKIAKLDLTVAAKKDVGWFDVWYRS